VRFEIVTAEVVTGRKEHALARNEGVFVTGFVDDLGATVGARDAGMSRYVSATYLKTTSAVLIASS
jgi:hypothetical protein